MTRDADRRTSPNRVILELRASSSSVAALKAAVAMADALHTEIDSVFVEDDDLTTMATLSCTRQVALVTGRSRATDSQEELARAARIGAASARRQLQAMAAASNVRWRFDVAHAAPVAAVTEAVSRGGPGSLLAWSEPYNNDTGREIAALLERPDAPDGFLLVGARARSSPGPTIIAVERPEQVDRLVAYAENFAARDGGERTILVVGESDDEVRACAMEIHAAHAGGQMSLPLVLAPATLTEVGVVSESVRRLRGGLLLAELSGLFAPGAGQLRRLLSGLECPFAALRPQPE